MAGVGEAQRRDTGETCAIPTKGADLFGQYFAASGQLKGGVVVSTGIHQHTVIYEAFAARLASEGFAVLAYDHRGFGRSPSYEGHGRSQIPEWISLDRPSCIGDLLAVVDFLKRKTATPKVFVWGHSLGGVAAVGLATSGSSNAFGYILSNPTVSGRNLAPDGSAEFEMKRQRGCNPGCNWDDPEKQKMWQSMPPDSEIWDGESSSMSNSNFQNLLFYRTWTEDPAWSETVEKAQTGKLMPFKALYLAETVKAISSIRSRFHQFEGHALVLRSGKDPFEGGGCTDLCIAIMEAASSAKAVSLTLQGYPAAGHDLIFEGCSEGLSMEAGKNCVVDDIVAWLNAQVSHYTK